MRIIEGYDVKIFTDNIEENALDQIKELLSIDVFSDKKIRIMPDVHAGAGCVIGFTGDLGDKVIPNIVGVDIGCGMRILNLGKLSEIDFHAFHEHIRGNVPSGMIVREDRFGFKPLVGEEMDIYREAKQLVTELYCYREIKDSGRINKAIGSLGGGNHFIEVDRDDEGRLYLVVHSGSRNLGKQVAEHYQAEAADRLRGRVEHALAYCEGDLLDDYLHDMQILQRYADLNRKAMMQDLVAALNLKVIEHWTTIHNYIDLEAMILRKGAISAKAGEKVLIPLNMRDGSLIALGKGNPDWNFSAPHGAGRAMSRSQARRTIRLEDYEKSMQGIFSTTVDRSTIDEAPSAYKPVDEILHNIRDTVTLVRRIYPVYNFKAAE